MGLLDKLHSVADIRKALLPPGVDPFNVVIDEIYSSTEASLGGRRVILAGTNNYLGLTFDQQCIDAAREALLKEGTGTTGSRMANGTYAGHRDLEQELALFYGCSSAIVFSTALSPTLASFQPWPGKAM